MPDTIQANTACESRAHARANECPSIRDTCAQMVHERIPNLFRLYLNPYVAQTCYCLTQLIESEWPAASAANYQAFLANSMEEALSGAIKLARYTSAASGRSSSGLLLDDDGRLEHFASTNLPGLGAVEYVPGLATEAISAKS